MMRIVFNNSMSHWLSFQLLQFVLIRINFPVFQIIVYVMMADQCEPITYIETISGGGVIEILVTLPAVSYPRYTTCFKPLLKERQNMPSEYRLMWWSQKKPVKPDIWQI